MELCEGVEHIKSVHVNDSSVDCELRSERKAVKGNTTERVGTGTKQNIYSNVEITNVTARRFND